MYYSKMTPELITFYIGITTILSGTFTFTIRALLKSNCVEVKCGCVECKREHSENPNELEITVK
jgi:hypothetical protein